MSPLIGYKNLSLGNAGWLSPYYLTLWPRSGYLVADCVERAHLHPLGLPVPSEKCGCGIYISQEPVEYILFTDAVVLAQAEERVIVHESLYQHSMIARSGACRLLYVIDHLSRATQCQDYFGLPLISYSEAADLVRQSWSNITPQKGDSNADR